MILKGIGLGTWPFANPYSLVSDDDATHIVRTFLDLGGQFIDTAPAYSFGEVERRLGRILKGISRERYYLSSKCGYIWDDNKQLSFSGRRKNVIQECEKSLERLNVETLDLYFSHFPDPSTPFEETIEAMVYLQEQGKVKDIGVSNVSLEQLKEYTKFGPIKFVQNRFSFLNQSLDSAFSTFCQDHNIGVTAVNVINRGLLTDKVRGGINLREGDQRQQRPEFNADVISVIAPWINEHLIPISEGLAINLSTLAIWWALQQPAIALCIIGATKASQIPANLKAADLKLSSDVLDRMNESYRLLADNIEREYSKNVREFMGMMPMTAETVLRIVRGQ